MKKYSHLLSPIIIGENVLKNRMFASKAFPHFLQGPETFPTETVIAYYANLARNGAAVVTVKGAEGPDGVYPDRKTLPPGDGKHIALYDPDEPGVENYFSQMADAIHYYGAKASISLHGMEPDHLCVSKLTEEQQAKIHGRFHIPEGKEMTHEDIEAYKQHLVKRCLKYQSLGFDMCNIYMTYKSSLISAFLSPATNYRTDEYGGSTENRVRIVVEICDAIKKACGKKWMIEAQISGEEECGYDLEEMLRYVKLLEGKVDILHIRAKDAAESHPVGFNSKEGAPVTLRYAEAVKSLGVQIVVAPNGGYQDLDECDRYIAEGKADMITMGRAFICDYDYYLKAVEGRGDDVVPCIRCNKCHAPSMTGPWVSYCSVNPLHGIHNIVKRLSAPAGASRKVAVIGGGPAGMNAALYAKAAGHSVTLYESTDVLGGQLKHADYASFKWPLKKYKDWLIYQMDKQQIRVMLNTTATPQLIMQEQYDVVIAANGAIPAFPDIPGKERSNVYSPIDVYGIEEKLGKNIVVIGGSETGTETGMYLAECGHNVTVLTRQDSLAPDATVVHYSDVLESSWQALPTFTPVLKATTVEIGDSYVKYLDGNGKEQRVAADDVVLCGGVHALTEEAVSFSDCAAQFFVIGDARCPGNVHHCTREAYAAADRIV